MSDTITTVELMLQPAAFQALVKTINEKFPHIALSSTQRRNGIDVTVYCDALTAYKIGMEHAKFWIAPAMHGTIEEEVKVTEVSSREMLVNQFKLAPDQCMTYRFKARSYYERIKPALQELITDELVHEVSRTKEEVTYKYYGV